VAQVVGIPDLERQSPTAFDVACTNPSIADYLYECLQALPASQWAAASLIAETFRWWNENRSVSGKFAHAVMRIAAYDCDGGTTTIGGRGDSHNAAVLAQRCLRSVVWASSFIASWSRVPGVAW
jgi:hypothetical protein